MLNYDLSKRNNEPLYARLARAIRQDIQSGRLAGGEKLPSKRRFAQQLGVSNITVETAYEQLMRDGFIILVAQEGLLRCRSRRSAASGA